MTDKELIRALRYCGSETEYWCNGCPGERCCDEGGHDKILLDAADRLEALLAENERLKAQIPKWRPASEPPKESINVFARDMAGVVTTAYYNGRWHGMLNCDAVTHWMPIPSTEGVE